MIFKRFDCSLFYGAFFLFLFFLSNHSTSDLQAKPRDKERWDSKYSTNAYLFGTEPISFIKDNLDLLPKGQTLDLAMGEGRNGVYLATKGHQVTGLDISPVGLNKAEALAAQNGVKIETRVTDLENPTLKDDHYDLILCTYYMQRSLFTEMKRAVKKGGMVLIETYNEDYLKYQDFNPKWALKTNELLEIFKDFKIIRYQSYDDGKVAFSSILAQKP